MRLDTNCARYLSITVKATNRLINCRILLLVHAVMAVNSDSAAYAQSVPATNLRVAARDIERPQHLRLGDPEMHGVTASEINALRTILSQSGQRQNRTGRILAAWHKGDVIFKEAFGNLTIDQKVLMASSSKPVTATVLVILADQGKLRA